MLKIKNNRNRRGLTLIEALIWFAIFAAVVAGVFTLYSNSRDKNNAETVNKELATIFANMDGKYGNENTKGLNTDLAMQLGIFPQTLKQYQGLRNIFGGTVSIIGMEPRSYIVLYTKIPSGSVCSNIVRSQRKVGWYYVQSITEVLNYDNNFKISDIPRVCGNNGDEPQVLTFYRN